jgi:hypothetical protein
MSIYEKLSKKMNNDISFRDMIYLVTSFLPIDATKIQRLWHYIENISVVPDCKHCRKPVSFKKIGGRNKGYKKFCDHSCQMSYLNTHRSPSEIVERKGKIRTTCMEKYGVEHYFSSDVVKQKKTETFSQKYGVKNPSLLEWVKKKKSLTLLEKYGVDNPSKVIEFQSKKTKTTKSKSFVSPSGKLYKCEGYEDIALNELFSTGYTDSDVFTNIDVKNEIGIITYYFEGRHRIYHPDIFIKSQNKLIEVKSEYWYNKTLKINQAKKDECQKRGFIYEFWVYNPHKNLEKEIK